MQGFGGERFDLVTPDKNMSRAKIRELDVGRGGDARCSRLAGLDYQALKAQSGDAATSSPCRCGMTASFALKQKMRTIDSQNVDRAS